MLKKSALFLLLFASGPLCSEEYSVEKAGLEVIASFADKICAENLVQSGNFDSISIDGGASAEFRGLVKDLLDLGIDGAGQYINTESQGVLQDHLADAMVHQSNCKKDVFYELIDRLMPASTDINPFVEGVEELLVPQPLSSISPGQRFAMEEYDTRIVANSNVILTTKGLGGSLPPYLDIIWTDTKIGEQNGDRLRVGDVFALKENCFVTYYAAESKDGPVSLLLNCN